MLSFCCMTLRRLGLLSAAALPFALGAAAFAQSKPVQPTPAQSGPAKVSTQPASAQPTTAVVLQDPTKPETQPPLDVDRDPIPSIDPDEAPTTARTNNGNANPREAQKGQNGMYVLHADVDEVLLDCAVMDEKGRTLTDLTEKDFRIWEDGVQQTINAFRHQDQPVSMGILVDNSGSMRDKRTAVNAAAFHLLRASNPQDAAFIVNFSDRAYLDQGFTSDLVALNRGLSRYDSHGTTALYDAVAASADELSKNAKHRKEVLLIITDGADNASRLTLQQTIRRVQDLGGPVVYAIGLEFDVNKDEAQEARQALQQLSQETGGVAYFPRSVDDVDRIAAEVAQDIRNQYVIAYHSTKPASLGGYRTIHVEARGPSGSKLVVRTRRGYYASTKKRNQDLTDDEQAQTNKQSTDAPQQ
jgi:Ca-activated chloride channel homolog